MAITYDWYAPYWHRSGGASPNSQLDGRSYWVVSYEQHPENLTTTVYVEYRLQTYNGGPYGLPVSATGTAYINGNSIGSKTLSRTTQAGEGYKFTYGGSNSTTIYHNSDGSASFTFQGKSYSPNVENTKWTNVQTIYLPNIATSPTVSISGAGSSDSHRVIIGDNISVVLGNTQGRSTTITYPGGTYTTSSDGTYSLQIPTSLINSYTNTRTPQGTVSVSNSIGSNSVSCYMYISDSYKPEINTFSFNGSDSNYPTLEGMYVQNLTTPKFTGTATFKNGATIASSKINITNYSGTGSLNFSGNNFTYTASIPFSQSGTHTATSQITDSRSIPSDVKTSNSVEVIPYQSPSVSSSYVRCDYEGNPDESNGKYMKLTLNYKYYLIWYYGNPSGAMNYLNLFASGDGEYFESYQADPSQGRSGDISCSYSKSFILDNGKEQTTDTVYIEGKRYFTKSGNTYTVINYTPGAAISGTVYEGKQFALSDSKDIYYRFSDITGSSQLISIRTSPAYTLISRLHGDAGHGITLGQVATATGFHSYLENYFHDITNHDNNIVMNNDKSIYFEGNRNNVSIGGDSTWISTEVANLGATKKLAITDFHGGEMGFATRGDGTDNQMYCYVDGKFYQNEGHYPCLDSSSVSLLWSDYNSNYQEALDFPSSYLTDYDFLLITADDATQLVATSWIAGSLTTNGWNSTLNGDCVYVRQIWYNSGTQGLYIEKCYARGINGNTQHGWDGYHLVVRQIWGIKIWK